MLTVDDIQQKTSEELKEMAEHVLFGRNGYKPRITSDFERLGSMWAKLESLQRMKFNPVKSDWGSLIYAECAECGKRYKLNQYIWQYRHHQKCSK